MEFVRHGVASYAVPAMPRVVHQMWLQGWDEVPQSVRYWRADWVSLNAEWDWQFWDVRRFEDMLLRQARELWPMWEALCRERVIKRADFARMVILYVHGGLYADMDLQPLVRFAPRSARARPEVLCVGEPGFGSAGHDRIANGFVGCPPGLDVWMRILEAARPRMSGKVLEFLGPRVLGPALIAARDAGELELAMVPFELALQRPPGPAAILHNHEVRSWGEPEQGEMWYDC